MYAVTGYLYKNDKLLMRGMYEDLEKFVEELKELNKIFVDRREFKVISPSGDVLKQWFSKWWMDDWNRIWFKRKRGGIND